MCILWHTGHEAQHLMDDGEVHGGQCAAYVHVFEAQALATGELAVPRPPAFAPTSGVGMKAHTGTTPWYFGVVACEAIACERLCGECLKGIVFGQGVGTWDPTMDNLVNNSCHADCAHGQEKCTCHPAAAKSVCHLSSRKGMPPCHHNSYVSMTWFVSQKRSKMQHTPDQKVVPQTLNYIADTRWFDHYLDVGSQDQE